MDEGDFAELYDCVKSTKPLEAWRISRLQEARSRQLRRQRLPSG